MRLNKYQTEAKRFACYPEDEAINYLIHGLNGEVGEVSEKIAHYYSTNVMNHHTFSADLIPELGDVLWYLADLATRLGRWKLEELTYSPPTDFLYNDISITGTLTANCNLISNCYKKVLRGDRPLYTFLPTLKTHLSIALWAITVAAERYGTTIEALAEENLLKLAARQEKNLIKGDGDNR